MEKRPRLIRSAKFFLPPGKPLRGRAIAIRFYSSNFFESLVADIFSRHVECRFATSRRTQISFKYRDECWWSYRTGLCLLFFLAEKKARARGQRLDRFDDNDGETGAAFKVGQRCKNARSKRMMEFCEQESFFEDKYRDRNVSRQLFVFPRNERKGKFK